MKMAATSMFPSVGAINHFQGMSDGYNIFQNLSGTGSGLASAQLSVHQAHSILQHQRSAELEPEHLAELDAALLNYDGEYVSQVPHKEKASRSATHLRQSAKRSDSSQEQAAGRAAFDDYLADELHNI